MWFYSFVFLKKYSGKEDCLRECYWDVETFIIYLNMVQVCRDQRGKKSQLLFGRCFVAKWITNASMILIQFPVGNSPHHKNRHHSWQSDCQLEHVG